MRRGNVFVFRLPLCCRSLFPCMSQFQFAFVCIGDCTQTNYSTFEGMNFVLIETKHLIHSRPMNSWLRTIAHAMRRCQASNSAAEELSNSQFSVQLFRLLPIKSFQLEFPVCDIQFAPCARGNMVMQEQRATVLRAVIWSGK